MTAKNTTPLVLYHADCLDGIASAWVVWEYFDGEVDLIPVQYGEPIVQFGQEREVIYIIDFSYGAGQLRILSQYTDKLVVIDHHKTAVERLQNAKLPDNVELYLDTSIAGCIGTFKYFHTQRTIPDVLKYIADRDMWEFKYENTKAICSYLYSKPLTVELIDNTINNNLATTIDIGETILEVEARQRAILKKNKFYINIGKYSSIIAINAPAFMVSELADELLDEYPLFPFIAIVQYTDNYQWKVSLRSRKYDPVHSLDKKGVDVSIIAKSFGGGGHRNAAGFYTTNIEALGIYAEEIQVKGR